MRTTFFFPTCCYYYYYYYYAIKTRSFEKRKLNNADLVKLQMAKKSWGGILLGGLVFDALRLETIKGVFGLGELKRIEDNGYQ